MFDGKKTICMILYRFNDEMTAMLIGFDPFSRVALYDT